MPSKKKLDLSVEIDVLTAGAISDIIIAIFETLLFQRNQIPFVYKTYRFYVNKWQDQEDKSNDEDFGLQNMQVQRKKQQATDTKEAISSMRQVIKNVFENRRIKCLRFLFGPTTFTAKEAYTVHIPTENIAVNHFHEHHTISQANLNQTLLSLVTSEDLYNVFSSNLNPTNVYLELEILEPEKQELKNKLQQSEIFPKDFSSLPASCKDVHIYLLHTQSQNTNYEQLTCCKDLQVFEDLIQLKLDDSSEEISSRSKEKSKLNLKNLTSVWWEAETVVRGFKDNPIKGLNIWN